MLKANQSSFMLIRKQGPPFALLVKEVHMSEQDVSGTECGALGGGGKGITLRRNLKK
jgi:hypothetical protein